MTDAHQLGRERAIGSGGGWAAAVVVAFLVPVYLATATWTVPPYSTDAWTNAVTGWYLANDATVVAAEHQELVRDGWIGNVSWFVPTERGPISQYPPGTPLTVAPFYLLTDHDAPVRTIAGTFNPDLGSAAVPFPPLWPATLSAIAVTAGFAAALAATAVALGLTPRWAASIGVAAGTTTSAWSVAADQTWTHGPGMLAVGLAGLAASRDRWWLAGAALGGAVLVRPHLALIAAALGAGVSIARRELRPLVAVGTGSTAGLLVLITTNAVLFGTPSITGGYSSAFSERALTGSAVQFLGTVWDGLTHHHYGLLVWAPHLVLLTVSAWRQRRDLPDWTVASAVGGALYLLVQWRANRASGGTGFFPYRYPLEAIAAAAPVYALAAHHWWTVRPRRDRVLLVVTVLLAFAGQFLGAVGWSPAVAADGERAAAPVVEAPLS